MRKRSRLSMIGAGFAMALAAITGGAQATTPYINTPMTQGQSKDMKATGAKHTVRAERKVHAAGGLDLIQRGDYGMSPMQYGMLHGNGASRKGKTNKLQRSHSYKVAKR